MLKVGATATEMASNPVFGVKLGLIAAGVLNAAAFHQQPFKSVHGWDVRASTPPWARAAAVIPLVCWSGAITCGRLLAYFSRCVIWSGAGERAGPLTERPRAVTKIASLPSAWGEKNSTTSRS